MMIYCFKVYFETIIMANMSIDHRSTPIYDQKDPDKPTLEYKFYVEF